MLPRILLLAVAVLAGCAGVPERRGTERSPTVAAPSNEAIQTARLVGHLQALQTVITGSPAEQAEVMEAARQGYEQARQGPAALRYGLLLAAPLNPARDPQLAQRLLREVMARPDLLSAAERTQAQVELARIDAELKLGTEYARVVTEAQQERERQRATPASSAALTRRLQVLEEERARLARALDEANAKLKALADIERDRSTTDRPPATPGRTP